MGEVTLFGVGCALVSVSELSLESVESVEVVLELVVLLAV